MTEDLDNSIAITALKKMFNGSHFNICCFDQVAKMLCVIVPTRTRERLHPLHCIDWGDMPDEVRVFILETCEGLFHMPTMEFKHDRYKLIEPKKGWRLRLLGGG